METERINYRRDNSENRKNKDLSKFCKFNGDNLSSLLHVKSF